MNEPPTVITGDLQDHTFTPRIQAIFVLDRLRSAHNVGNIFRIAEITGISGLGLCGYTATPPHPKLAKTARGCDQLVPFRHFESSLDAAKQLKAEGYELIAIETVAEAEILWETSFTKKAAFFFGNEAEGVNPDTLNLCDRFVKLPTFGFKNSLNVGNCASIVAYELVRQQALPID